jgi:hypothetical protein
MTSSWSSDRVPRTGKQPRQGQEGFTNEDEYAGFTYLAPQDAGGWLAEVFAQGGAFVPTTSVLCDTREEVGRRAKKLIDRDPSRVPHRRGRPVSRPATP